MENKVLKRRGRPNRGGGRFNRGRGRGRGRGLQQQQQTQSLRGHHHGHGGRKGGSDFMADYEDGYSDGDYDFRGEGIVVTSDSKGGSSGLDQGNSRYGKGQGRGAGQATFPKRNPVKVTMQHLQMSFDNQEMVKDMLRDLHGEDIELNDEDGYNELDHRAENQYWMVDNMKIEDTVLNDTALFLDGYDYTEDITVSSLAVNKLERYGFHKSKATEALQVCDSDIGLALEYLLAQCFNLNQCPEVTDLPDHILEQREDEMMALMSIYEEKFVERIKNKVWILKLSLSHLKDISKPKRQTKIVENSKDDREVCRNYLKGVCKFGRRCKWKHEAPVYIDKKSGATESGQDDCEYEVEIRFPAGNKYPEEVPFIAFTTTSCFTEKHVCLNITKLLIEQAKDFVENCEPCVFSLINELESEEFLDRVVKLPPHEFSCPPSMKPWLRQQVKSAKNVESYDSSKTKSYTDRDLVKATKSMLRMADNDEKLRSDREDAKKERIEVKMSTSKEEFKKQSPAEILKTNRRLIDDFKRKKESSKYKNMQEVRQKLPAWDKQDEILEVIESNQVVVISGMTGCGKTTQVPQFILDLYLNSGDLHICNVLCTQPRRISAMAVAERVAQERADSLGRIVGYQIRLEKMQSSMTRLLFCTTGIVLRRLEGDTTLDGVTHVILDEVHERSEESDFLLMYLRDMLPQRPDLKVILMSATLNAELFSTYFGGCPVVDIPGRTFPVEQYFLEDVIEFTGFVMEEDSPYARSTKHMNHVIRGIERDEDQFMYEENTAGPNQPAGDRIQDQNLSVKQLYMRYPDYQKSTIKNMAMMDHAKINFDLVMDLMVWIVSGDHTDLGFPESGAILVFMPGYAEIQTLYDMLLSSAVFCHRNRHRYKIIPLHSTLSSDEQQAVFSKPPEEVTKIVIATNIAETSITIDDICFVIDAGKMKEKRYDSTKGMESLDTVWVSKANALQRKGRAGRVQEGVCFHMFTRHRFEHHLQDQPIPEIQRAPLEQIVLRIRMLEIFKQTPVKSVLDCLPEPPSDEAISTAINRLENLGALDKKGELTPLGYHLGTLPVDVRIGKLMLFGAIFRCLDPALTIAACLSFKSPFVTPFGKKAEATAKKLEFAVGNSDHLTMMNAYNQWLEAKQSSGHEAYRFCQDNFLSQRSLQMLASMKQQFVELLSDIGFVQEGISAKDVEKAARITGGDGVPAVTGQEANLNGSNMRLVSAILVGALYPNIVQVLTPEQQYAQTAGGSMPVAPKSLDIRFKTKQDGYIKIHPSSVNFQVRYYESPYLVYHEKVKTTRIYVRDCTMVSVYPLLLFGGGQIDIDLSKGNFILSVDEGWIRFRADSHQVAELVRELRLELDQLLTDKIENPHMDLSACPRGSKIISTIVRLITTQ